MSPYVGPCNHLHGHSFVVTVAVTRNQLDARGFVIDFAELKPLKAWIDTHFDHATLVSRNDHALAKWLNEQNQKHYSFEVNPTSEVLAQEIFIAARELGLNPASVSIEETCTSNASYEAEIEEDEVWRPV